MPNINFVMQKRLEKAAASLRKNRMQVYVVDTKEEVSPLLATLLPSKGTVAVGGSASLDECNVLELLRSGNYTFWDRYAPDADPSEIHHKAFGANAYLTSANAITLHGEVVQVDGRGNRVAAMIYGPESVFLVVGRNKIVADVDAARERIRQLAAPANTHRLGCKTPCATTGFCSDCSSPARICCTEVILRQQMIENRIKIILVNEDLGF